VVSVAKLAADFLERRTGEPPSDMHGNLTREDVGPHASLAGRSARTLAVGSIGSSAADPKAQ